MFSRVSFEGWHTVITIVAFVLTSGAFFYLTWRTLKMKKEKRDHMAHMPLQDDKDDNKTLPTDHGQQS